IIDRIPLNCILLRYLRQQGKLVASTWNVLNDFDDLPVISQPINTSGGRYLRANFQRVTCAELLLSLRNPAEEILIRDRGPETATAVVEPPLVAVAEGWSDHFEYSGLVIDRN